MKRITNRLLALILVAVMAFGIAPVNSYTDNLFSIKVFATSLTTYEVTKKLDDIKSIYDGKFWNAGKTEEQLINAVKNNKTDAASLGLRESGCKKGNCSSNKFGGGIQCFAFAFFLDYYLFRAKPNKYGGTGYTVYQGKNLPEHLQPGDHIINGDNGHSATVWKVEEKEGLVSVVEVLGSSGCKIHYGGYNGSGSPQKESDMLKYTKKVGGKILRPTGYIVKGLKTTDVDKTLLVSVTGKHSKNVPYKDGKNVKKYNVLNEEVHAKKSVFNIYNNLWYQLDDNSWVFSGNFSEKAVAPVKTHASKSSNVKTKKKITSLPAPVIIPENDLYTIPGPAPVLDGYVFMGYSTKEKSEKAEYQIGQSVKVPKGGLNLYTVWKKKKVTIELSEESANLDVTNYKDTSKTTKVIKAEATGELSANNTRQVIEAKSNNTYVADVEVTDNKYSSFLLWDSIKANIKITAKSPGTTKIQVTVSDLNNNNKAQCHINVKVDCKYKITYYTDILSDGGTVYDKATQWKTYGKDITLSSYIPEKENYLFAGWTQETGSLANPHVEYGPGDLYKMEHDIIFYPVWVKDNKITWNPPVDGVLTIGGSGDMPSYSVNKAPWQEYKSSIKKVIIKEGVTSVGSNAFYGYTNLEEVVIPEGVTYVGNNAFYNTGLKSILFPYSIKKIGNDAYGKCKYLEDVGFAQFSTLSFYANSAQAVPSADVEIGAFAFEDCTSLKSIDIPESAGTIGAAAFKGCSNLETVELPESIETINDSTFFGCSSLSDVTIPEGVKNIGDSAFDGCEKLPAVLELPDGLESIGDSAFSGCSSITKAEIPESVVDYGNGIFANCTSLTQPVLPDNLTEIPDGMFMGCSALSTPVIPDSVEVYGDGCFRGCSSLKPINYSDNVISINNDAFNDCDSLDTIVIPSSVTNIGDYAFSDCDSLVNADLNEGLTVIGAGAFAYCDSLEDIAIPASCKRVESGAFMECSSLKGVDIPDTDIGFGSYVFAECSSLEEIQFPKGTTEIGDYMFSGCSESLKVACFSTSSIYEKAADTINNIETITPVESIALDKSELNVIDKESVALTPVISPSNATDKSVNWFVDHPEIASVDENGVVTIYGSGTFTVTAQTNDEKYSASCVINSAIPVRGIALADSSLDAYTGDEITLHYTFEPLDATNFNVTFSSSNENVASVSADGEVTVNYPGEAIITVTTEDGGYTSECKINAEQYVPVEKVVLDKNELTLRLGESAKINASCQPLDASSPDIIYFIAEEDKEILEIDESGNISTFGLGQVEIKVIADNTEEICLVNVLPVAYTVTWNVDGNETTVEYEPGATIQKPAGPVKDGFEFKGWTPNVPETMPANDLTFTAVFEKISPVTYTLAYDANGGKNPPTNQTGNGNITLSVTKPTRDGYTFKNWNTKSDGKGTSYKPGAKYNLTANATLYAIWQKNETPDNPDNPTPDKPDFSGFKIKNYNSTLSVDYKSTIIFHTTMEAPDGYEIVWSNGEKGSECTLNSVTNKEYKVSAKMVNKTHGVIEAKTEEVTVTVNTGFFAKIIAFFRNLFGSLPTYEDFNKK